MEWYNWVTIGLGVAGFALQGLVLAIGGTWKLAQMESRITATVSSHRAEVDVNLDKIADDALSRADTVRREFGETVSAMQKKIQELEIWARDTFVRRESFLLVTAEVKKSVEDMGTRIEKRIDRMDEKLDDLQGRKQIP